MELTMKDNTPIPGAEPLRSVVGDMLQRAERPSSWDAIARQERDRASMWNAVTRALGRRRTPAKDDNASKP